MKKVKAWVSPSSGELEIELINNDDGSDAGVVKNLCDSKRELAKVKEWIAKNLDVSEISEDEYEDHNSVYDMHGVELNNYDFSFNDRNMTLISMLNFIDEYLNKKFN